MTSTAKIRINLNLREFEIEGTEEFINSHSEKIDSFLELLKSTPPSPPTQIIQQPPVVIANGQPVTQPATALNGNVPENFGEYYHLLPRSAKDSDKILIAGHFAQLQNPDASFATSDATTLLLEQGVRLSNSTAFIKANINTKRIIQLGKGKFKVSRDGVEYLKTLLSGNGNGVAE